MPHIDTNLNREEVHLLTPTDSKAFKSSIIECYFANFNHNVSSLIAELSNHSNNYAQVYVKLKEVVLGFVFNCDILSKDLEELNNEEIAQFKTDIESTMSLLHAVTLTIQEWQVQKAPLLDGQLKTLSQQMRRMFQFSCKYSEYSTAFSSYSNIETPRNKSPLSELTSELKKSPKTTIKAFLSQASKNEANIRVLRVWCDVLLETMVAQTSKFNSDTEINKIFEFAETATGFSEICKRFFDANRTVDQLASAELSTLDSLLEALQNVLKSQKVDEIILLHVQSACSLILQHTKNFMNILFLTE